ncbi:MAG TPA: YggS family pyridoxal phosphate-dependent enzyme [Burkholderiaceae bacterium]|nr:YggS family pyridoxal phosphate-dependent enzyme [Burkholderiaceae bacterium]
MTNIQENIDAVLQRIAKACNKAQRKPQEVTLLAVTKTVPPELIKSAIDAGQRHFGENYVNEGVEKITNMQSETKAFGLVWHCIGPVQSNKTRLVAEHFDWVHSIDRLKIAQRLSDQRPLEAKLLQVCIQVNIDGGVNKSGVAPEDVLALANELVKLPRLKLRGIMSIPEPAIDFEAAQVVNMRVRAVFDDLNRQGLGLDTLSLGMSADLEPAIAAGSTMVRVGTAIFGARAQRG